MHFSPSKNAFFPSSLASFYKSQGSWPKDAIKVSQNVWQTYGQGNPPPGMQRGADDKGHPVWIPTPPPDLETLAKSKRAEINAARDAALAEGLHREIAGEPDVVQTRPQDQINLLGLRAKAEAAIDQGIADPVMKFRGENNVTRYLTPDEMYALTNDALAHIESIYDHSWERKDAIDIAFKEEDRERIDAISW